MNLLQIHYFLAAADCLSFTQAADLLYITQPALSRQITAIEKELNLQLFVRTSRAVRLTPAGQALYEELRPVYHGYQRAVARAKAAQQGLSGRLNIGVLDGTRVDELLPPVLEAFSRAYPYVELSLSYHSFNTLASMLYDGGLDLALTLYFDVQGREKLRFRVLEEGRDHIVLLRGHPLALRESVRLWELRDETFIIVDYHDSAVSPRLILDACRGQGFTPPGSLFPFDPDQHALGTGRAGAGHAGLP